MELPAENIEEPTAEPVAEEAAQEPKRRAEPPRHRVTYGDVLGHPVYRRWIIRAVVAGAVGIVTGLVFGSWRVGLTFCVLAAIADTLYRANTASSIPAWRKLGASERKTERQLRAMARSGYRALHARAVPGSDAQIDHLVVGPTGVYAIDSENWDPRLPIRTTSHRKLFHGPFNKKDRLDEARWEASQASQLISAALGREIEVRPSLAVYGPRIPWDVLTIRDVDVYTGRRARKYLKRHEKVLSQMDVERIARIAERVLPPRQHTEAPN